MAKVKNPPTPFALFLARNLPPHSHALQIRGSVFHGLLATTSFPWASRVGHLRRMLRQKGDLKMDNEKQSGQQSGPPNPSQKDPQKERDSQQQRQGGTQQDPQRRPGQSEQDQDRDKDQQKDRKSA
jgi:hypothetical protein